MSKNNIDPTVRKQIEDAVNSNRMDPALSSRLQRVLSEDDASLLERRISFLAEGSPTETPQGLTRLTDSVSGPCYSGHNHTYATLVKYVHLLDAQGNPVFTYVSNKNLSQPK